jgi:tripeptidyl-peptidase I
MAQTYSIWVHESGDTLVRTESYSLPEHLHSHVEVVQPTTMFSLRKPMHTTFHWDEETNAKVTYGTAEASTGAVVDVSCNSTITPACLKALYHINYKGTVDNGNRIGITGYLEQVGKL